MATTVFTARTASCNLLLAALPPEELEHLLPGMRLGHLEVGQVVFERENCMREVHLPLSAVLSMVNEDERGGSIEVGTVGFEGMNGIPVVLDSPGMPTTCLNQIEGDSIILPAETVRREMLAGGVFAGRPGQRLHPLALR